MKSIFLKMDHRTALAAKVVALVEDGRSQRYVAERLAIGRTRVQRIYQRFQETGSLERRAGSGRKKATSQRDDRFIVSKVLRDRHTTAVKVKNLLQEVRNVDVSEWTVRRRLREANLKTYKPAKGPKLLPRHKVARLQFARAHRNWTLGQWSSVLFSDESRFCLHGSDGRNRVWRRPGERYAQCNFAHRISFQGGSLMVWAGISFHARTELVFIDGGSMTAHRYVAEVLEEHVVPYAPFVGNNFVLMHDNARPHTARIVTDYLLAVGITCMDWPALSPDLNVIEHIWDELSRRVKNRSPSPNTLGELQSALREEWGTIPQEFIQNLIMGMNRRMQAVINARGGNTHY